MSDIVIKGMEMPKTCRECIEMKIPVQCRVIKQEPVTAVMTGYNRPKDCPLKELPPHGRLIDADLAEEVMKEVRKIHTSLQQRSMIEVAINTLKSAPTILEASEE